MKTLERKGSCLSRYLIDNKLNSRCCLMEWWNCRFKSKLDSFTYVLFRNLFFKLYSMRPELMATSEELVLGRIFWWHLFQQNIFFLNYPENRELFWFVQKKLIIESVLRNAIETCLSSMSPEEKHFKRWKMHIYTTGAILREIWRFSFQIQLNVLT